MQLLQRWSKLESVSLIAEKFYRTLLWPLTSVLARVRKIKLIFLVLFCVRILLLFTGWVTTSLYQRFFTGDVRGGSGSRGHWIYENCDRRGRQIFIRIRVYGPRNFKFEVSNVLFVFYFSESTMKSLRLSRLTSMSPDLKATFVVVTGHYLS